MHIAGSLILVAIVGCSDPSGPSEDPADEWAYPSGDFRVTEHVVERQCSFSRVRFRGTFSVRCPPESPTLTLKTDSNPLWSARLEWDPVTHRAVGSTGGSETSPGCSVSYNEMIALTFVTADSFVADVNATISFFGTCTDDDCEDVLRIEGVRIP